MAITCTNFTSGTSTTDSDNASVASKTYLTGKLYIFTVRSRTGISTTPNTPSLTLTGLTIALVDGTTGVINTDTGGSSRQKESVFYCIPASDVTGVVALSWGGQTQTAKSWVVDELNADSNPIIINEVKNTVNTGTPATSITATLTDTSSEAVYGAYGAGNASANNPVVGSGFTEIKKLLESTEDSSTILTEFKASFDGSVDVTFDSDYELGIVAIGLKEAGGTTYNSSIVDSMGITDVRTRVLTSNRSMVDSLGLTDSLGIVFSLNRAMQDSMGLLDVLSSSRLLTRSQVDSIGITDTVSAVNVLVRALVDAEGITDSNAYSAVLVAALNDAVGLDDTLSRTVSYLRSNQDSMGIADVLSSITSISRSIVDAMSLSDIVSGSFILTASLVDDMGVVDTIDRVVTYTRSNADDMGVTDVINTTAQILAELNDAMGLTDSLSRTSLLFAALVDSEGVVDVLDYTNTQGETTGELIDSLGITDTLTVYLVFRKPSIIRLDSIDDIKGQLESVRNK